MDNTVFQPCSNANQSSYQVSPTSKNSPSPQILYTDSLNIKVNLLPSANLAPFANLAPTDEDDEDDSMGSDNKTSSLKSK
jgi:hypothetical protein